MAASIIARICRIGFRDLRRTSELCNEGLKTTRREVGGALVVLQRESGRLIVVAMITAVAFTVYPVRDVANARKFYESALGLKLTHNFRDEWLEYDLGDTTFAISSMDRDHQPGLKGAVVAFEAEDFDAFIKRLKAAGATFIHDTFETPVCRMAVVADPEGNHVIIHQRHAAT
jgi:predicted enzyme related to lactoylglutathione lyase